MPRHIAPTAIPLLLLGACSLGPEPVDPDIRAFNAGQRIKLENLAYCTVEAQESGETDDQTGAIDRCMARLGYVRQTAGE